MRAVKHWTPRYIGNRLRVLLYERLHPDDPWLTNSMVNILESWLKPEDMGIEWGSGRSTIWLAGRVKHLTSVEHDGSWYGKISSRLQQREISNVDYRLCADEVDYVATSEGLLPESLDFCLVDGIARDQCAIAVIPKLKPGGILIIDNCNWYLPSESKSPNSQRAQNLTSRNGWKFFLELTKCWRCVWTTNGVTDTAFWVKPSNPSLSDKDEQPLA